MNVNSLYLAAESKDEGGGFGAFGSLLMDAAKDAQADRDSLHARRVVAQEKNARRAASCTYRSMAAGAPDSKRPAH